MSLVSVHDAEWRKRKINLFSVLRSFVSQLSPGQELTKVSLPSELCHPFSMLELVAYRELQLFHIIFEVNQETEELARFLAVVRWYLGLVREETMEKKPFNPVIEETHLCWVDHQDGDISDFISEQVSHHPPVSAFIVRNKKQNIMISGAVTFQVGFGSNCASVTTGGQVTIHTDKELYTLNKCVPDMMVNNVIWGEKYLMWNGTIIISCSANKYVAHLRFSEQDSRNVLSGEILNNDKVIYTLSGFAGKETYIKEPYSDDKKLFVDISIYKENTIIYIPEEVQTEFNSLRLWKVVKDAIIRNDMTIADEEKKKIEANQRVRQKVRYAAGIWKDGKYFSFFSPPEEESNGEILTEEQQLAKGTWIFKNNFIIDSEYIESISKEAEQIRAKLEAEKALAAQHQPEEESQSDENDSNYEDYEEYGDEAESNDACSVQ